VSFAHAKYGWNGDLINIKSKIEWNRDFNKSIESDICFFTDMCLHEVDNVNAKIKIALLLEPYTIFSKSYEFIMIHCAKFDYVLSHNTSFLKYIPNGIYYPHGGTWINEYDWNVYIKNKNISIISSQKTITNGHKLRHKVISQYNNKIDFICGRGYRVINDKLDALKDFRASIVIENCINGDYFSEKLIDCFLTGTIPIYWNDGFISKYFNINGMLIFNNIVELHDILNINIEQFYYNNIKSIVQNFELAKNYTNTETWIYDNILIQGVI
jgi:hypothetical protein